MTLVRAIGGAAHGREFDVAPDKDEFFLAEANYDGPTTFSRIRYERISETEFRCDPNDRHTRTFAILIYRGQEDIVKTFEGVRADELNEVGHYLKQQIPDFDTAVSVFTYLASLITSNPTQSVFTVSLPADEAEPVAWEQEGF